MVAGCLDLLLLLDLHEVNLVEVLLLLGRGCGRDRPRLVGPAQLSVSPVQLDSCEQVLQSLVLFVEEGRQVVVALGFARVSSTLGLERAMLRQGELTAHSYS